MEEDWSPSGGLNMSRIDNVVFRFAFVDIGGNTGLANAGTLRIYARNHNVVKIESAVLKSIPARHRLHPVMNITRLVACAA